MACLTNRMFFLAPEQHIIVITGLCHSPHALRTDRGGQMDTGGAGGREASGSLVSSQLRWHYSLFSPRKLSVSQGHWCLETFSQKSFDRTQSIQDGLSSHKLLKTNILDRRNSVVITEIIKIKKAKKNNDQSPCGVKLSSWSNFSPVLWRRHSNSNPLGISVWNLQTAAICLSWALSQWTHGQGK